MSVWKGIMQQMENLVFSLNATVPVFLMMILGLFFKKIGFISDTLADEMNKFVFLIPLPVLVFSDLATVDFEEVWNMKFVLFCFGATVISIAISTAVSFLWQDKSIQGEFIQSSYRSASGNCVYPEYLRDGRHGSANDHWKRAALQYDGCTGAVLISAGPEWAGSACCKEDADRDYQEPDYYRYRGWISLVSASHTNAQHYGEDGK